MLPVEVLVPGANSRSTCKHCGIYTGPSLLEPYKSHNNIYMYIYKAAYNSMMNHVIIFLVKPLFQAYHRLAKEYHPDKNPEAGEHVSEPLF